MPNRTEGRSVCFGPKTTSEAHPRAALRKNHFLEFERLSHDNTVRNVVELLPGFFQRFQLGEDRSLGPAG